VIFCPFDIIGPFQKINVGGGLKRSDFTEGGSSKSWIWISFERGGRDRSGYGFFYKKVEKIWI